MFNLNLFLKKNLIKKSPSLKNPNKLLQLLSPNDDITYWSRFGENHRDFAKNIIDQVITKEEYASEIFHLNQLIDDEYRKSYNYGVVRIISHVINCMEKANTNSDLKIADFACWSGVTSRYLSNNLKVNVTGIEVNSNFYSFANDFLSNKTTNFALVENQIINLEDESQDIVLANAAFANVFQRHHEIMLCELTRILRPKGIFILIDSNNPRNLQVQNALKDLYCSLERPKGSFFIDRKNYISSNYPSLKNIEQITSETCYYTKKEIENYLKGILPKSKFQPNSLKVPICMAEPDSAPSNPTDPSAYKRILSRSLSEVEHGSAYLIPEERIETSCFIIWGQK